MCLRVFVASDLDLDALPVAGESCAPLVQQPPHDGLDQVRALLGLPCFVELGAWGSCACGFATDAIGGEIDLATALALRDALDDAEREDLERSQAAREALASWLEAHRARGARARLYACWWGGEASPVVKRARELTLAELRGSMRPFDEDVLYELAG